MVRTLIAAGITMAALMLLGQGVLAQTESAPDPKVAKCGKRGVTLEEAFKQIIAENVQNPGDAAKTDVTYQEFTIGPGRKWDLDDDGPGGDYNTTVYPVRVRYTIRRETPYNVDIHAWDNTYSCFSMIGDADCSCNLLTANPVELSVTGKPPAESKEKQQKKPQ